MSHALTSARPVPLRARPVVPKRASTRRFAVRAATSGSDKAEMGVVINAGRLDFDAKLDFTKLKDACGGTLTMHNDSTPTPAQIAERAKGHAVVISKEVPVDVNILPDTVKLICEAGTGYNNIDLAAAKARGITVCNVAGYSSDAVAHLVLTFVLNFSASIVPQHVALAKGDRSLFTESLGKTPHFELTGKTIGLVGGTGGIGSKVATIAKVLGMNVLVWSRSAKTEPGKWEARAELKDLLKESDFVSIHCPLSDSTKGIIDADAIRCMKPTAYVINTARGAVINEADLIAELKKGTIAGAGLDVQEVEPPVEGSELYTLPNVMLTPHVGWKRLETRQRLMDMVADNVDAYNAGAPINVVSD